MTARGLRNNNPGNIIKSSIDWVGEKESLEEQHFEVFDTPEHGLLALCKLLISYQDKHGCRSVRSAIARWAPPSENDTGAYVAAVGASIGVDADADVDFHDPRILGGLARAIVQVENGSQPYSAAQIDGAVAGALGVTGTQPAAPIEEATPGAATVPQQGKSMGAGLILGLVQTALQAFAPLAQQKITGELARHTDADTATAVAQNVMDAIQKATGKADPIEAVVALKSAPQGSTVVQAAQDDALARLDRMAPVFNKLAEYQAQEWKASDDSMDKAAERSPTGYDMTKPLVYSALGAGGIILVSLMTALITYAVQGKQLPEMLLTLIVQTVTGFLGFIALLFAFRFGSSRSSAAKDEVVAQLSKQRG